MCVLVCVQQNDSCNVYLALHFCFGSSIINSLILIIFITILYYHCSIGITSLIMKEIPLSFGLVKLAPFFLCK